MAFKGTSKNNTGANGTLSSTVSTATTPTAPAVGDLLVLAAGAAPGTSLDSTLTVSGVTFTSRGSILNDLQTTPRTKLAVFTRVWDGTEGASFSVVADQVSGRLGGILAVYSGVSYDTIVLNKASSASSAVHTLPSITTTANRVLVSVVLENQAPTAFSTPSGLNQRAQFFTSNTSMALYDTGDTPIAAGTYSGTTVTPTPSTNSVGANAVIALTPAAIPILTATQPSPGVIKAVGTPGGGGTLTFTLTQQTGQTVTPVLVYSDATNSIWAVPASSTGADFQVKLAESGVATQPTTTITVAAAAVSNRARYRRLGTDGVWA
jgi:hypothetical protein